MQEFNENQYPTNNPNNGTGAKTCGILSIVFSSVSFLIFGFLSIPGLILGICGLVSSVKNKLNGSPLILNIIGTAISAIAFVLYLLTLAILNALFW